MRDDAQINTHTYVFFTIVLSFMNRGPAQSLPMSENGGGGVALSSGSGPIFWPQGPTPCLSQMTHFLMMSLTSRLPWVIQILCLKVESKVSGTAFGT